MNKRIANKILWSSAPVMSARWQAADRYLRKRKSCPARKTRSLACRLERGLASYSEAEVLWVLLDGWKDLQPYLWRSLRGPWSSEDVSYGMQLGAAPMSLSQVVDDLWFYADRWCAWRIVKIANVCETLRGSHGG